MKHFAHSANGIVYTRFEGFRAFLYVFVAPRCEGFRALRVTGKCSSPHVFPTQDSTPTLSPVPLNTLISKITNGTLDQRETTRYKILGRSTAT